MSTGHRPNLNLIGLGHFVGGRSIAVYAMML